MAKRCIILTVGVGGKDPESLISALQKAIDECNPNLAAFIYSSTSHAIAETLQKKLHSDCEFVDLQLKDENNIDIIFSEIVSLIDNLIYKYDCDQNRMTINYTSGTKAMSAGAALAAVSCQIGRLQYIAGERKNGVVQNGLENILTQSPTRYLSYYAWTQCLNDLKNLRYDSALSLYNSIKPDALPINIRDHVYALNLLIQGYQSWDQFDHRQALNYLSKIKSDSPYLAPFLFPKEHFKLLSSLASATGKESRNKDINQEILADMMNNAERRIIEGKYDDALARLYRLTEMFAQFILIRKHNMDTANVDENKVPPSFKNRTHFINGKTKIGMHDAYDLLREFGDSAGINFENDTKISSLLQQRNHSILAHGTTPIGKEACNQLKQHIEDLIAAEIQSFNKLRNTIQFPWLQL